MMRRGFTLVETIIAISIISITFYLFIASLLMAMSAHTGQVEAFNKKVYLAQELIEEHLCHSFSNVTSVATTNFPGAFSAYQYQILVSYVATMELNTPVAGPTKYKNVKVQVWGGLVEPAATVEIVSLATSYEAK